jgi:hypothetical protein
MTKNFEQEYWNHNYSEPDTMDGIGNAKAHVKYIKSVFDIEHIDISSIIDFGFGYGVMLKKLLKAYIPYKASGIEPSKLAFNKAKKKKLKPVESTNLYLYNEDLKAWCERKDSKRLHFDLGICMSVLQYIPSKDLDLILSKMAERVKFLYLTVPTDIELDKQIEDLKFHDHYAIRRSREFYQKKIGKYFTFISSRVLESKVYFDESSSSFTDLLYRF